MSSAQPSANDRKSIPVAYGLPCADCGTYYPSHAPKCPTCGSATRGPFTSSGKHAKPRTSQVATPANPPITGATERLFSRLAYGLPCAKCGCYYGGNLNECPTCHSSQRGARIFGPQPVKAPVSAAILATTARSDRVRGLGLPCADCGAYYSGDVSACLNCGSSKRGPLASGKRLGPTLVTSAKTAVAPSTFAASPRPATRTVKTGLPCAKCHSYYDADLDTCPSCGHRERRRIATTLPLVEVAASPEAVEVHPEETPVVPASLLSERAASLASEIADLLAQKLHEPDLREGNASSELPHQQLQEFLLAPTEPVALPQLLAETPGSSLSLPASSSNTEPSLEATAAAPQPTFAPAEPPAPVVEEVPAVHGTSADAAPEASAADEERVPVFAFDLAAFAPAASAQHFVVETEPSILDDPNSLAAAISRAVDKAMRALPMLPAIEAVLATPVPPVAPSSTPEETAVGDVEAAARTSSPLDLDAESADVAGQEVSVTSALSAAPVEPVTPVSPQFSPLEPIPLQEAEAAYYSEQPLDVLPAEPAARLAQPDPPPVAMEHPVAEAELMLSIPESAWLDCPTCHASYDAALDTCPACAAASALEPITAEDAFADSAVVAPAQPEVDLDVLCCSVCNSPYPASLPALQGPEELAPAETVVEVPAITLVAAPVTALPGPAVDDEAMTLIDALDFFEALTRKLRA